MRKEPVWLRREFVIAIHERLIADHGGSSGLRDEGLLESALARPKNLFAYGHPSISELAASYAVGIAKNHAFVDGNKRTAFVAATVFLARNGLRITASEADATVAMLAVASGSMKEAEFAHWLGDHAEKLPRKPRRSK
jgi:death on curing protein